MALSDATRLADFSSTVPNFGNINSTGVVTTTQLHVGTAVTVNASGADVTGVVTATSFVGDGSNLTGLATTDFISAVNVTVSSASTFSGDVSIADKIVHTGDTNAAIRFPAADTFTVETAGTERVRVDSGGLVGIGTDNPANKISACDSHPSLAPSSAGAYVEIARTTGADAGFLINHARGQYLVGVDNSDGANAPLKIEFGAAGSSHPGLGATTKTVSITSDGDVGIGTDNPTAKLHIQGNSDTSDAACQIIIEDEDTTAGSGIPSLQFVVNSANTARIRGSDDGMTFSTGGSNTDRMLINTVGSVGIGTNAADRTLDVHGTVITNVADLGNVSGVTTLNFTNNNNFILTLTGTTTFADPTGIATGQSGVIILKQDGTGSRTATFHHNFKFKAGTAPTLSTGVGKSDAIAYYCFEPPYIVAGTFIGIGTQ